MEKMIGRLKVINEWNGQQASYSLQAKTSLWQRHFLLFNFMLHFANNSTFLSIFHILFCFLCLHKKALFPLPSSSNPFREFVFILQDPPHVSQPFESIVKCPFFEIPHILNLSLSQDLSNSVSLLYTHFLWLTMSSLKA